MEIKIVINKQNKEEILRLIGQLVEWEEKGITAELADRTVSKPSEVSTVIDASLLGRTPRLEHVRFAEPQIKQAKFGAWGMFNSFVPGKAALRVLINLIESKEGKPIRFSNLVDASMTHFSRSGLYKYRGFPKKTSESARSRLAMHLIMPYSDMGMVRVYDEEKDPLMMVTTEGLNFSKLPNPLLDMGKKDRSLSVEESNWLIGYLKEIDELGYKEFSLLENMTRFLTNRDTSFVDIANWFKSNQSFVNWLRSGSRYRDDPKAFSHQLDNVARTFASGKIALLRELGIVSGSRATYQVLRNLEEA